MKKVKDGKKVLNYDFEEVLKWLPVKLTQEEVNSRAVQMSQLFKEQEHVEVEKARVTREFGETLKRLGGEISKLSTIVASGEEHRNVSCEHRKHYGDNIYRLVRCDTGEIIEQRELQAHEKQKELMLTEDEKTEEPDNDM